MTTSGRAWTEQPGRERCPDLSRRRGTPARPARARCPRRRRLRHRPVPRVSRATSTADYIGVDVVRHPGLSPDAAFHRADLDRDAIPLPTASADIVAALETIEHLESPRAFCRELTRVLKPGGWLVVSTPNQLSVLSILCLIVKGRFVAFQDGYYPIHRTALLPIDLVRIAGDCGLVGDRARVLVRRPDSADRRALSADAVADVPPGAVRQRGAGRPQGCVIGRRFWVSVSASAIRTLPFGRYQLANALARFAGTPFLARLPLGPRRLELCLRSPRHDLARSVLHRTIRAAGNAARSPPPRPGHGRRRRRRQLGLFHARLCASRRRNWRCDRARASPASRLDARRRTSPATPSSQVEVHRVAARPAPESKGFVGFDEQGGNWGVSRARAWGRKSGLRVTGRGARCACSTTARRVASIS